MPQDQAGGIPWEGTVGYYDVPAAADLLGESPGGASELSWWSWLGLGQGTAGDWLDRNYGGGNYGPQDWSGWTLSTGATLASYHPAVGRVAGPGQAIMGRDLYGNELSTTERGIEAASAAVPVLKAVRSTARLGKTGAQAAARGTAAAKEASAVAARAPRATLLSCFPAGTLVATEAGAKPIESVVEGELVWAYDLVASDWRLRRVLRTYSRPCEGLAASVTVNDETVVSTSRHPYFVTRGERLKDRPSLEHLAKVPDGATTPGRWVDAGDLRAGDELVLLDGRVAPVEDVRLDPFADAVYNFEVDDLHCYAVGRSGVLVHNNNGPEFPVPERQLPGPGPVGQKALPAPSKGISTNVPTSGRKFNQIARRGWTRDGIDQTINHPFTTRPAFNKATGNPATAYFNRDGSHVIRDNVTGDLVQLSDRLSPGSWIPDSVIINPYFP